MAKAVKMIGQVFNEFTVLADAGYNSSARPRKLWLCQCSCGAVKTVSGEQLRAKRPVKSCGHIRGVEVRRESLVGKRFGRLTAESEVRVEVGRNPKAPKGRIGYDCLCECGTKHQVAAANLVSGQVKSCGCIREDRSANARCDLTKSTWLSMIQRCKNPNSTAYKYYGNKGITLHPRWSVYENFLADMGERVSGVTLDRIDNEKGYAPGNCRWATWEQQMANRSGKRRVQPN